MTLKQTCNEVLKLAVDNTINGRKFTLDQLYKQTSALLSDEPAGNLLVYSIMLEDGEWWFSINRYSDKADGFDYYIPETREQEAKFLKRYGFQKGILL